MTPREKWLQLLRDPRHTKGIMYLRPTSEDTAKTRCYCVLGLGAIALGYKFLRSREATDFHPCIRAKDGKLYYNHLPEFMLEELGLDVKTTQNLVFLNDQTDLTLADLAEIIEAEAINRVAAKELAK